MINLAHTAYNLLSTGLFLTLFPPFLLYSRITGRHSKNMGQRFGLYPDQLVRNISGSPRIWIHAVSVGEVGAAIAIIKSLISLMPDCAIILSTTTENGQEFAKNRLQTDRFQSKITCIYAPIDLIASTRKALSTLKPDILVCLETEIWPNWLIEAHRMGIKTAIVNGRISARTVKRYLKIRPLIEETLKHVDAFSMIRKEDAQRIEMIGAPTDRIEINGNAKYDLLLRQADESLKIKMKRLYNLNGDEPVFVAGSTRSREDKIIIDVYCKIVRAVPKTLLLIAPKYVERARHIENIVKKRGLVCQLRTDLDCKDRVRTAPVVIINTIGELQATYSIASIVFCGGSLVPLGGQNVLEAAVWGKPVLYGPSIEDFLDAKELFDRTGGGIQVKNGQDLAEKVIYYLTNPRQTAAIGRLAKKAVMLNREAATKHAAAMHRLLNQKTDKI